MNGRHNLTLALACLVTLTLFSMHFYRAMTTVPVAPGRVAFSFVLFLSAVWGNFITVYSAHYCAFGACARRATDTSGHIGRGGHIGAAVSRGSNKKSRMDSKPNKPTKRRDLIIFGVALLIIAYFVRDELIFFIQDKGGFLAFDSEYDEYIVAADEAHPMATIIQDLCKQTNSCPENPVGWKRRANSSESVAGDMVYLPLHSGTSGDDGKPRSFQAFRITYDYNPGWQLLAHGGVGKELTLERRKHRQGKE